MNIMTSKVLLGALSMVLAVVISTHAANPIIPNEGVCDPHIHVFNNRAYLFTGHDDGDPEMTKWNTMDWQVWSSADMVEWKKECVLRPEETYIKKTGPYAWAGDGAERHGKYYFYFSNVNIDTGVAVADAPGGPYRDALGKPLLPARLTATRSYDPTVFIDDDEKKTPYILFGTPKWAGGDSYYIARMNQDMVSLAKPPKKIILQNPDGTINVADDKNFLHKRNGIYYLSWQAHYATSGNIYGPYIYRGNVGSTHDHASFCSWNNQWFMCLTIADRTGCHRAPGLCYIHYQDNGEMAPVEYEIKAYGVGRYEGTWPQIQAEWYMAANNGTSKREIHGGGFDVRAEKDGAWLPAVVKARIGQVIHDYPNLDYFIAFSWEGMSKIRETLPVWEGIVKLIRQELKEKAPSIGLALASWGSPPEWVAGLQEDVICAPIAPYSPQPQDGRIFGTREFWACP